jgi:hypothetical protein
MSDSEDITVQDKDNKHGNSMESPRLSNLTITEATHSPFQIVEETANSELEEPHQDGGNSSDTKTDGLSMREERLWMSMVAEMMKTETSLFGINMVDSTSNGTSSIKINGREIQERENSTKTSVCMLIEPSTLSHK